MAEPLRAESFQFLIRGLALPVGLVLDELRIEGERAELRTDPFGLAVERDGRVEAEIGEAALATFLRGRMPKVSELDVRLADGRIHMQAAIRVVFEIRGHAIARLLLRDERQILVALDDVQPASLRHLLEGMIAQFNPVFDAADLPLQVRLDDVAVTDGRIRLTGRARP